MNMFFDWWFATSLRLRQFCWAVWLLVLVTLIFLSLTHDAPRDKCTLSCAINGIHAAFHYLKKNYISGCVMTVPTGW